MPLENSGHDPADEATLARVAHRVDAWAGTQLAENPAVLGIDTELGDGVRRWLIRLTGEEKTYIAVWFALRQRSLAVETYFMPAPEENAHELYRYLLRLNTRLVGLHFAIAAEDAVYLAGAIAVANVDERELDRLLGSAYGYTEAYFRPAMRIGYATKFQG